MANESFNSYAIIPFVIRHLLQDILAFKGGIKHHYNSLYRGGSMYYKALVFCKKCSKKQWIGFYDTKECCGQEMSATGHERYDIHGALWIASIRRAMGYKSHVG